jgi:hypothetical protein
MQNNDIEVTHQILNLMKLVLSQNYFTFLNKIYQPGINVAIGPPNSNTFFEIFLTILRRLNT